jgi:hypothetical protein
MYISPVQEFLETAGDNQNYKSNPYVTDGILFSPNVGAGILNSCAIHHTEGGNLSIYSAKI